ncbi:hypothetical protein DEO72_LG11g1603 [Vigna unguiculata]|uniref:Uncharacterized protein n=1 Tax=Vigna unguiculata TaxID=3917 RepID=A0A4D6NLC8_VIGUN|nr:hypothetical protein DEO72_LG11g1603 [Vigna unguiculata]
MAVKEVHHDSSSSWLSVDIFKAHSVPAIYAFGPVGAADCKSLDSCSYTSYQIVAANPREQLVVVLSGAVVVGFLPHSAQNWQWCYSWLFHSEATLLGILVQQVILAHAT